MLRLHHPRISPATRKEPFRIDLNPVAFGAATVCAGLLSACGGGGYNGAIPGVSEFILAALKRSYPIVSSDSGHQGSALDGVNDGVVSSQAACSATFDAAALRCPAGGDAGNSCLSDAQLAGLLALGSQPCGLVGDGGPLGHQLRLLGALTPVGLEKLERRWLGRIALADPQGPRGGPCVALRGPSSFASCGHLRKRGSTRVTGVSVAWPHCAGRSP